MEFTWRCYGRQRRKSEYEHNFLVLIIKKKKKTPVQMFAQVIELFVSFTILLHLDNHVKNTYSYYYFKIFSKFSKLALNSLEFCWYKCRIAFKHNLYCSLTMTAIKTSSYVQWTSFIPDTYNVLGK